MKKLSKLCLSVLVAGLLAVSGCTSDTSSNPKAEPDVRQSAPPKDDASVSGGDAVDPQVLDDVVAGAFPAPGASVRRRMRVETFIDDFSFAACGSTERLSIDRTTERSDQEEFPDLDLIRTKGFTERHHREDKWGEVSAPPGLKPGCNSESEGNLIERVPSFDPWLTLSVEPWSGVAATMEQDPSVVALKAPFAECLREGTKGTGIVVSSEDPARTFLPQLDLAQMKGTVTPRDMERRMPVLYATCGEKYFGLTQELLEAERPAMIERHRELLEQFAREIVAIGYVP